jgi:predicted SAM-dependent methyltransferase
MDTKKIKINVGCGTRKIHGFINVDIREEVCPDILCGVERIHEVIQDADLIYASHVLEHFPSKRVLKGGETWMDVLESWHKTLKVGGILRVCVPDFDKVCERYSEMHDLAELQGFLHGGQKNPFDYHYHSWDFETLCENLRAVGFSSCKRFDWRATEHAHVDDYSQAYLPHMDKQSGMLMSLNVEAVK